MSKCPNLCVVLFFTLKAVSCLVWHPLFQHNLNTNHSVTMEIVTKEMNQLKTWFDRNKLSLNLNKTKFMLFGNFRKDAKVKLSINNVEIEQVSDTKFRGVTIDNFWKHHTKHLQTKLSRSISVLSKAKHLLHYKSLCLLYCSLILPYLEYCVEVWGNTYKTSLQPLCNLQKKSN